VTAVNEREHAAYPQTRYWRARSNARDLRTLMVYWT